MKKQNIRTLSLIVVTFTYLLIGAAVFDYLESDSEYFASARLKEMERIWKNRFNIEDEDFKLLETIVLGGVPHRAGQQWKFAGAFYYATTVLTTIGYGHSTPKTLPGKMFTLCYAIVGIPLCLILFHSIGERLNKVSSIAVKKIKRLMKCSNKDATEVDLILVVTSLSAITITAGAAVFSSYEKWTYFDSFYYCVITLTTIGFGDMVALQKNQALKNQPEYVIFSLVFILFGMAIVAACLNLFVLRFVTMNTEDERRDEAEALHAAAVAVRLEGDVITANGSILSGVYGSRGKLQSGEHDATISLAEIGSVCSCTCVSCNPFPRSSGFLARNRYSIRKRSVPSNKYGSRKGSGYKTNKANIAHRTITQEELCSSNYDGSSLLSFQLFHRGSV